MLIVFIAAAAAICTVSMLPFRDFLSVSSGSGCWAKSCSRSKPPRSTTVFADTLSCHSLASAFAALLTVRSVAACRAVSRDWPEQLLDKMRTRWWMPWHSSISTRAHASLAMLANIVTSWSWIYTLADAVAGWESRTDRTPVLARAARLSVCSEDRLAKAAEHSRKVSKELVFFNRSVKI